MSTSTEGTSAEGTSTEGYSAKRSARYYWSEMAFTQPGPKWSCGNLSRVCVFRP